MHPAPTITMQVMTSIGQANIDILPDSGADICSQFMLALGEHMDSVAHSTIVPKAIKGSILHPVGCLYSLDWTTGLDYTGLDYTGLDYWTDLSPLSAHIITMANRNSSFRPSSVFIHSRGWLIKWNRKGKGAIESQIRKSVMYLHIYILAKTSSNPCSWYKNLILKQKVKT